MNEDERAVDRDVARSNGTGDADVFGRILLWVQLGGGLAAASRPQRVLLGLDPDSAIIRRSDRDVNGV